MRREADPLPTFGYLEILGLFIGMIFLCFLWGIWEYKKPKDPGPLFIDLNRTIEKRVRVRECSVGGLTQNPSVYETIRVRGDLRIPKGEVVPYNMIVEGNLTSQEDVIFQGGLHVRGRAVIGVRNRLEKSIVCQKELLLSEDVIVYNCIDCEGLVFIKNGVRIGLGVEGGGIASASTIYLENARGPLRIHSKARIHIVGTLEKVIPKDLEQTIEVKVT